MTCGGCESAETFVLKPYLANMMIIRRVPRTTAPSAMPSITTKMSLLGDWTKTHQGVAPRRRRLTIARTETLH